MKTVAAGAGISITAIVVLIAANGRAFVEAIAAVPIIVDRWSAPSAIGLWAVVAGLAIPGGIYTVLKRLLPAGTKSGRPPNWYAREVAVEAVTALSALAVVFTLLPHTTGLLLGIGCALFAAPIARAVRALLAATLGRLTAPPPPEA